MARMTSTEQPTVTLQPIADEKNLLVQADAEGSCCGGGCCSTD
ncbi:hypothetical protein GCM10010460_00720 [Microbacterium terrae]|uniref:Uncharacterized protein n=1 Tax=Microbacterium terrae TaxID=69369 RepID=A0A0M2H7E1_9MICO|nr:hypothetical protein RS81_01818 [Microbacterium terrae]GLJ99532.1 hypothetical protein GCM10017594_27300 [Microbacterium terrae]